MKYPQEIAKKISKNIQIIADEGCLAFTYMWCLGLDPDNAEAIELVSDAIDAGKITKKDGVLAEPFIAYLTGRKVTVTKANIESIKEIKKRTPVWYTIDGKTGHWVGVENGKIKFNSILNSKNVAQGKPRQIRIIKLA